MDATLVEAFARTKRLIAERAYDADHLRDRLRRCGANPVVQGRGSRDAVYSPNRRACRRRNVFERVFGWLKT